VGLFQKYRSFIKVIGVVRLRRQRSWTGAWPERLVRAQLLQIFYSIRSERLLMEQLDYNLLFRWFVGLAMDEPVWTPTVFTKNRDRLLNQEIARSFFREHAIG
jgi:transposase